MKALFGILLLLFLAASAALIAARNPGYVLIAREPFVLETSLAVFVLLGLAFFTLLYVLVRLAMRILRAPRDLARWRQTRRTRKAREAFHAGLLHLLGGDWIRAEQDLLASLHASDSPLLTCLAAALAAHGQNDSGKRDQYLAQAQEYAGKETLAAEMLQARLQLLAGELEPAQATLARVRGRVPAQPEAMRLLIDVLQRLHDWQGLTRLLPEARRRHLLAEAETNRIELETQRTLLGLDLPPGALDALHQAWAAAPNALRAHPALLALYARQLLRQNAADECVAVLGAALDKHWDEQLAQIYGEAHGTQTTVQLETAEEWLARHGESAALMLTLGRLAHRQNQNERARGYLEKSLALTASREAHRELAGLYEEAGDTGRALDHYRRALDLCQSTPPAFERPGVYPPGTTHYGY
jgi:HemY protein